MVSLAEKIPPTPSSFERTSNVLLAIAGAFLIAVIVWYATENQIYSIAAALAAGYLLLGVRIVRPTHRVLVEFLGKFQKFGGPGFYWVLPGFQKLYAVNITEKMVNATRQEIITADNLNATVDAQVYFKVKDDEDNVKRSQYNVFNYEDQIVNLARTTLRNIIGTLSLKAANSERSRINDELGKVLKTETQSWGIEIVRTELKEIMPPPDVQDTMNKVVKAENEKIAAVDFATARETEADGLRRAAIKQAEGVKQAKILEAAGQAEAIRLVNEAADKYFVGNAQRLKALEVTESALKANTKIVLPEGREIVNVIGDLAGSRSGQE
jgi:regulator of protease activity HflC (stomatin/prohibitin superfamily)